MKREEIEKKVVEIIATKFSIERERIRPDTRLAEELGIDSFGAVELLFEIEEAFGLKISDSDLERVGSVREVVDYAADWLEKKPVEPPAPGSGGA